VGANLKTSDENDADEALLLLVLEFPAVDQRTLSTVRSNCLIERVVLRFSVQVSAKVCLDTHHRSQPIQPESLTRNLIQIQGPKQPSPNRMAPTAGGLK